MGGGRQIGYAWLVQNISSAGLADRPVSAPLQTRCLLKRYRGELEALRNEADAILQHLVLHPTTEIARDLCSRFFILQEHFFLRYREARAWAIATLGYVEAMLSFP